MSRVIVNADGIGDLTALRLVAKVMEMGRISDNGKSYCFATRFYGDTMVIAKRNKGSDSFRVYREDRK